MKELVLTLTSIFLISIPMFLISCAHGPHFKDSNKAVYKMSSSEIDSLGLAYKDSTICINDTVPIADIQSFEFECYKGKLITEISITVRPEHIGKATEIMRYAYTKHPRAKIEINFDTFVPFNNQNN